MFLGIMSLFLRLILFDKVLFGKIITSLLGRPFCHLGPGTMIITVDLYSIAGAVNRTELTFSTVMSMSGRHDLCRQIPVPCARDTQNPQGTTFC